MWAKPPTSGSDRRVAFRMMGPLTRRGPSGVPQVWTRQLQRQLDPTPQGPSLSSQTSADTTSRGWSTASPCTGRTARRRDSEIRSPGASSRAKGLIRTPTAPRHSAPKRVERRVAGGLYRRRFDRCNRLAAERKLRQKHPVISVRCSCGVQAAEYHAHTLGNRAEFDRVQCRNSLIRSEPSE